jgi:hypothetical protein
LLLLYLALGNRLPLFIKKGLLHLNLLKVKGGLGDIMTLMAGGNQKLTGEDGAFITLVEQQKILVEDLWILLVDIGKVTDAAGKSSYDLLGYGKNVAKGMASDQQQGYFGAFGGEQESLMLIQGNL